MSLFSTYITNSILPWYKNLVKSETIDEVKRDVVPDVLRTVKQSTEEECSKFMEKSNVIEQVSTTVFNEVVKKLSSSTPLGPTTIIQLKEKREINKLTEITHESFELVLKVVNEDLPVYLVGPAGSGKNVICKQVAKALGLNFYFTNAVTQEYKLTGFIDANGTFHETEFYKAFKDGGLFFLDELDASIPEVLVILNAAIANRYFDFPNGKIEAHKNFRVIAAGNTFGTGADSVYTGRFQLDGASLDRFTIIPIGYSERIEKSITNNNRDLIAFCHSFRKTVTALQAPYIFSYRALVSITALEETLGVANTLKMCLFKSMQKDDLSTIYSKMRESIGNTGNKYYLEMSHVINGNVITRPSEESASRRGGYSD